MGEQYPGSSHESADKQPLRKVELTKAEWQALHMSADPENDLEAQIVMTTHGLAFNEGDLEVSVYDADNDQRQVFVATTDSEDPFTRRRMDTEAASADNEQNEYDNLYNTDIELDEANGYSVENAAIATPESEKNVEIKIDYSINRLEKAAKADPQLLAVIETVFKDSPEGMPKDARTLIEALRDNETAAAAVTGYFREKAEYYRGDLPDRVQSNGLKKPNFPGGRPMNSLDVVARYAKDKIFGLWDPTREDGETDDNATVGQHREAAERILTAATFPRGRYER
jgi:hypothetical protein